MDVIPPSFDTEPVQMTGGYWYLQNVKDGRWYAVWNSARGEFMRWPSQSCLGLPEVPVNETVFPAPPEPDIYIGD